MPTKGKAKKVVAKTAAKKTLSKNQKIHSKKFIIDFLEITTF